MANAELNVILSADGKQLASTIQKAEKDVQSFNEEIKKTAQSVKPVEQLNKTLARTGKEAAGLSKLKTAGLDDFATKARTAGQAGFAFNQILREAPAFAFSMQTGLIGISNNLPIFTDALKRAREAGSSKIEILKGLGKQLVSLPSVLSLGTLALTLLAGAFTKSKQAAEESEIALKSYADAIDSIKDAVTSLNSQLQFSNKLGAINVKIGGGSDIQDLREQSIAQRKNTTDLEAQRDKLKAIGDQISNDTNLSNKDRVDAQLKYFDQLRDINKEILKSEQDQTFLYRQIAFQRIEDLKKANDEGAKANDKLIDATISRARRLAAYLQKTTIRNVVFELDPELSKGDQFKEALKFIQTALTERNVFTLKPQIAVENPVLLKSEKYFAGLRKEAESLLKDLQSEISALTKRNPILIEAERVRAEQKARGAELASSLGLNIEGVNAPKSLLTDLQKSAVNAANTINRVLAPAFGDLFNAIASGENPIKAFFQSIGQSVTQLISQLLQAAIQAAIISAIFPGLAGEAGGFGGLFKQALGFRAEGGPVFSGKPYVVGEKGPELFIPQGGGRIIPNNEMNSGLAGVTGGAMQVEIFGQLSGRDIRLSGARQGRFNSRNVG